MSVCSYCGNPESIPFRCKFCNEYFCADHHLPENHECMGLEIFKEGRGKELEKWIYEPFQEKYKEKVGREKKAPITEKLLASLKNINTRHVIYLILFIILVLLILEGVS